MKKECKDCKKIKDINEFSERNNYRNTSTIYYKPHCKSCMTIRTNKWVSKNREKFNKYQREYRKKLS